jgi:hypothetical protein
VADNLPDVYIRFLKASGNNPEAEIAGESLDAGYPGKEGWFGITEFSFGFGWGGGTADSGAREAALRDLAKGKKLTPEQQKLVADQPKTQGVGKGGKPEKKRGDSST